MKKELIQKRTDIELLRVISMIAVIVIHVVGNTLETFGLSNKTAITVYTIIKQLMFFALPIFFMLSGMLFLNNKKNISIKEMLKKYCLRILIVTLIVGFFFCCLEIIFTTKTFCFSDLFKAFINVVEGKSWSHMWYLYTILGFYLITPFLKTFVDNATKNDLKYILSILFVFSIIIPTINSVSGLTIAFTIPIISSFLFYYLYAHYIDKYSFTSKYKIISIILALISATLLIVQNLLKITLFPIEYGSLVIFLISNGIFVSLINKDIKQNRIITSLSECSFAIYLFHQFFINIIYKFLKFNIIIKYPYVGLILYTIGILMITYFFSYILRKIKLVRKFI